MSSSTLVLKLTEKLHGGSWGDDDFVVLFNERVVGRIFHNPINYADIPWMWTITVSLAGYTALGPSGNGHAVDRDAAMKAFRDRWNDAHMEAKIARTHPLDWPLPHS